MSETASSSKEWSWLIVVLDLLEEIIGKQLDYLKELRFYPES